MAEKKRDYMLGVDLGGTKILAAVVDPTGKVLERAKKRTHAERGAGETIARIAKCIEKALKKSGIPRERIAAVGVGAPGPLDQESGILKNPPNLPGWENVPIGKLLAERLELPVYIENDVNAGSYGEFRVGAGIGTRDLVGIFIGTGIGGGLIIDGKLHLGFNRTAGEIGHWIIGPDGPECGCGLRGCYEARASRLNVVRRMHEIAAERGIESPILEEARENGDRVRSGMLRRGWEMQDPCTVEALREMCYYTGLTIGGMINILNPEMFVLGGGVIEALEDELLPEIERQAFAHCFENARQGVRIRPAALGDDAGVLGAAFLGAERARAQGGA